MSQKYIYHLKIENQIENITKNLKMDLLMTNSGLQHVGNKITDFLDHQSLLNSRLVNSSWKSLIDYTYLKNPKYWLKKCQENMPIELYSKWKNLIEKLDDDILEEKTTLHLIKMFRTQFQEISENYFQFQSPLHSASEDGDLPLVKFILEQFNDFERDDFGKTPVHKAAKNGHTQVVQILCDYFDDPNASDDEGSSYGWTPISMAAKNGNLEIVQILLNSIKQRNYLVHSDDANVASMWKSMKIAVMNGHAEIVKALVFTLNPRDIQLILLVELAAVGGHQDVLKLLLTLFRDAKMRRDICEMIVQKQYITAIELIMLF